MSLANWHVFQVLTKRSKRMKEMLETSLNPYAQRRHIWWGVSVENKKHGLPRIDHLRSAPAAIRFLSVEPLIEDLGKINIDGISWVIVGGESGPKARPIKQEWVMSVRDQCRAAQVPFFFKQWGGKNKKKAGRMLAGKTYNEFPNFMLGGIPTKTVRDNRISNILLGDELRIL